MHHDPCFKICLQTQGDESAKLLIAAFEMRNQKGSQKRHPINKQEKLVFPSSLEASSRTIRSIAAAVHSKSTVDGDGESLFEAHVAEIDTNESKDNDDVLFVDSTSTRMQVALPHSSFKLDTSFLSNEQKQQRNSRIIPFRQVEVIVGNCMYSNPMTREPVNETTQPRPAADRPCRFRPCKCRLWEWRCPLGFGLQLGLRLWSLACARSQVHPR